MKHYVLTRMPNGTWRSLCGATYVPAERATILPSRVTCEWCKERGGNWTVGEVNAFRDIPAKKGES